MFRGLVILAISFLTGLSRAVRMNHTPAVAENCIANAEAQEKLCDRNACSTCAAHGNANI
jgi:hypothetical protein